MLIRRTLPVVFTQSARHRTPATLFPALRLQLHQQQKHQQPYLRNMSVSATAAAAVVAENKYENIVTTSPRDGVALITLNRPKALNALCAALFEELSDALDGFGRDDRVGAVVLTGSEKAFAAGADIKEMKDKTFQEAYKSDFLANWKRIASFPKPIIAAVRGFALGGGCELALMCDIVLASPTAKFGQPEINLGVIPGGGGTQRLTKIVGKSRAMEIILTGRTFDAEEAERWGVVSRIVGPGDDAVVHEAVEMAAVISSKGQLAVWAAKEAVNEAFELSLGEGLKCERRLFHGLFATQDQKEGMSAFVEKRKPKFANL